MSGWNVEPKVAAANIRKLRELAGLSRDSLADMAGLSSKTIENVENGRTRPNHRTYAKIAKALNTSAEKLGSSATVKPANWLERYCARLVERFANTSRVMKFALAFLSLAIGTLSFVSSHATEIDVTIKRELRTSEIEVVDWSYFITLNALWIVDVFNHSDHPIIITEISGVGFNREGRQATLSLFHSDPKIDREESRPVTIPAGDYHRFELRIPVPVSDKSQSLAKLCNCKNFEDLRALFKSRGLGDVGYPGATQDGNGMMLFIDLADGERVFAQADWDARPGK